MKKSWIVGLLGLGLWASTMVSADQLYVRNRPYKGVVKKTEGRIWVDLQTFAQALEAKVTRSPEGGTSVSLEAAGEASVPAGQLRVEGQEVACQLQDDGTLLVPLEETARLLGAKVIVNKSMGTIDVSMAKARVAGEPKAAATPEAASGPINRVINKPGQPVDISLNLVPGRINIVEFYADW